MDAFNPSIKCSNLFTSFDFGISGVLGFPLDFDGFGDDVLERLGVRMRSEVSDDEDEA